MVFEGPINYFVLQSVLHYKHPMGQTLRYQLFPVRPGDVEVECCVPDNARSPSAGSEDSSKPLPAQKAPVAAQRDACGKTSDSEPRPEGAVWVRRIPAIRGGWAAIRKGGIQMLT
jgi:hypothetical protein